jgi:hypothetical protein
MASARQKKKDPSCSSCKNRMPELNQEMEQIMACFRMCDTQLRASMGGAFAMDWVSVRGVAEALGIKTDELFYTALREYEAILIAEMNREK